MDWFWGRDFPGGPFQLFGPRHLIALGMIALVNIVICFFWRNPSEAARRRFRYGLSAVLLINESLYHLWALTTGQWSIQVHLPFHLCSILVYVTPIMLITKSYRVYEFCYFLGIGGAMQALLTPDVGLPPHLEIAAQYYHCTECVYGSRLHPEHAHRQQLPVHQSQARYRQHD